jgi:hypothetical protein
MWLCAESAHCCEDNSPCVVKCVVGSMVSWPENVLRDSNCFENLPVNNYEHKTLCVPLWTKERFSPTNGFRSEMMENSEIKGLCASGT